MPMDENLRAQLHTYVAHLDGLIRRGHQVLRTLASDLSNPATMAATRTWQEDCGVTINQLSGGSKAHWLARAFSEAFLMRSANGNAVTAVSPVELVKRTIGVLEQAVASLAGMNEGQDDSGSSASSSSGSSAAPPRRRFEFVHSLELRPIVEQAYIDSRRAFEQGNYDLALRTSCGILEAIVTDALEFKGLPALAASGAPVGKIAAWSFETRLAVAESAGLIRGGCARLPAVARAHRDHDIASVERDPKATVSERDARQTGQVLHVVMRDLDPGR